MILFSLLIPLLHNNKAKPKAIGIRAVIELVSRYPQKPMEISDNEFSKFNFLDSINFVPLIKLCTNCYLRIILSLKYFSLQS